MALANALATLLLTDAVRGSPHVVFVGSGGCDVSDRECETPATPPWAVSAFSWAGPGSTFVPLANYSNKGAPSWVMAGRDECFFATLETANATVSYARSGAKLTVRSVVPSGGAYPVCLARAGQYLLVANYGQPYSTAHDATVASFRVAEDCSLSSSPVSSIPFHSHGPDPHRQANSHIHGVYAMQLDVRASTTDVFAVDLGGECMEPTTK